MPTHMIERVMQAVNIIKINVLDVILVVVTVLPQAGAHLVSCNHFWPFKAMH